MDNLYYPQLSIGSICQYPVRKTRQLRIIENVMADGHVILFPDSGVSLLTWQLEYTGLSLVDVAAMQAHYQLCSGPLKPFTFLDPVGNLLSWSSDLTKPVWQVSPQISISGLYVTVPGCGKVTGVRIVNGSQASQEVTQSLAIPASYQYCLSMFVASDSEGAVTLFRRGSSDEQATLCTTSGAFQRIESSGRLDDPGTQMEVGFRLPPGQQVTVFGLQLEAQNSPSTYLATSQSGGVYKEAFFVNDTFEFTADSVDSFSLILEVEASC